MGRAEAPGEPPPGFARPVGLQANIADPGPSQGISGAWLAVAGGTAILVPVAYGVSIQVLRWFAGLFTRLRRSKLLDHPLRAEIQHVIAANPGIHFREITRAVHREMGVVRHHVDILVQGGIIHCQTLKGSSHYFPTTIEDARVMRALAALSSPVRRALMQQVLAHPGQTLGEASAALGLEYATVRANIGKLRTADLVLAVRRAGVLHLSPTGLAASMLEAGHLGPMLHMPASSNSKAAGLA